MDEQQWLTSIEPAPMLDYLRSKRVSDRGLRLYAVACCRRIWDLLTDERSRRAVEVAEGYSDGSIDRDLLVAARDEAREVKVILTGPYQSSVQRAANAAFDVTRDTGGSAANNASAEAARAVHYGDHNYRDEDESRQQTGLLRCIFGNPFRTVSLDPAWLTPGITSLARTIYDDRAFDRMPILGAAIQEAGCDNTDILDHCRSRSGHVRGCWVVDALLGKA